MAETFPGARRFFPASFDLRSVSEAARGCRGCDLYVPATQTVFGDGDPHAEVMFVGEQPGDEEDIAGEPFVGPAGRYLDGLMADAGLDRSKTWVTNVVKHFKWERRGSRRIHVKPTMLEIGACVPWLEAEIELVRPQVVVLMGATAAHSLLGRKFRVSKARGEWLEREGERRLMTTWHPSAILRAQTHEDRQRMRDEMLSDLRKVAKAIR